MTTRPTVAYYTARGMTLDEAQMRACGQCDGDGWLLERPGVPVTGPYVRCDHQPRTALASRRSALATWGAA